MKGCIILRLICKTLWWKMSECFKLNFSSESDEDLSLQALAKRQEAKEKSERGCGFLRRKWTVTEILTTSALYFEVFGFVSILDFLHFEYSWAGRGQRGKLWTVKQKEPPLILHH